MATEETAAPSPILRPFLRWAARSIIPLALVVVLGAIIGALLPTGETLYKSSVVVIPTSTDIPLDSLGSVGDAAFQTDTVLLPVIQRLGLNITPQKLLSSQQLTVQAVSTTGALTITAESRDPNLARDLANAAAGSFITVAGQKGLGTFAQFGGGASPSVVPPPSVLTRAVEGAFIALVLGLATLGVVYALRRPVMTKEEAELVVPARQVFGMRLWERSPWALMKHRSSRFRLQPTSVYYGLRDVLLRANGKKPSVCWVYVGPDNGRTRAQTMRVISALHGVQAQGSAVGTNGPVVVSAQGPLAGAVLQSTLVVMFVVAGVRRDDLVHLGEELEAAPARPDRVLVFVD